MVKELLKIFFFASAASTWEKGSFLNLNPLPATKGLRQCHE